MEFRRATLADLPAVVRLLADDILGGPRERPQQPLAQAYADAFAAIEAQPGNQVIVACDGGELVGCLQLTVIPNLTQLGMTRGVVEGVRVAASRRREGIGAAMMAYAAERARAAGCGLLQLTTSNVRTDAQRFYRRLGFTPSHVGMKLDLRAGGEGTHDRG